MNHAQPIPARTEVLLDVFNVLNNKAEEGLADDNRFSQIRTSAAQTYSSIRAVQCWESGSRLGSKSDGSPVNAAVSETDCCVVPSFGKRRLRDRARGTDCLA